MAKLHPIVRAAGKDRVVPKWVKMSSARRAHGDRVADLLGTWAKALELKKKDRRRWRAAGLLHDGLKDVSPKALRKAVSDAARWPDPLLHGPACAERLRAEGVEDEALLLAISHHTTGHPDFDRLGQALYMADYLEPGRKGLKLRRSDWRRRMPLEWREVLTEVAGSKISTLLNRQVSIPRETTDFWNGLTS